MNETNRSNYIQTPAYGKQLQQQRQAAQQQYMQQGNIPQSGYTPYVQQPQNTVPQGQGSYGQTGYTPYPPAQPQVSQPNSTYQQPVAGYQQNAAYQQPVSGYQPNPAYQQNVSGYQPGPVFQAVPVRNGADQQTAFRQNTPYQQPVAGYQQNAAAQGGMNYPPQQPYQQQPYQQAGQQNAWPVQPVYPNQTTYQQPGMNYPPQQPYPPSAPGYGGNYQPQQPQKPPRKKLRINADLLIRLFAFAAVPVLLVISLILPGTVLKWVFSAAAVLAALLLWIKPQFAANTRLTISVVLVVLAIVSGVTALLADMPASQPSQGVAPPAQNNTTGVMPPAQASANPFGGESSILPTEMPTATPAPDDGMTSEAVAQVKSFFYFWAANKTEDMVGLCAPSWRSSVSDANVSLFSILANRTPKDYTVEKISGTDNDFTRTVTITAVIDKNKGTAPSKYRMAVVMLKENETWYVDPRSLTSAEAQEETPTPEPVVTPSPTPEVVYTSSSTLYYNPKGGSYYHADPNCVRVGEKYRPLTGKFTYGEVNNDPYSKMDACNVCNAPLRQR